MSRQPGQKVRQPSWHRFVGTGLVALTVLTSPSLSAARSTITIELAASERALLTGASLVA
jgi:hypothetical protein